MGLFAVWVALSRFVASAIFERVSRAQRWLVVGSDEIVSSLVKDFYRIRVGEHLDQLSVEKFGQYLAKPGRDQGTAENRIFEPGQCAGVVIASKDDLSPEMINALMQARLSGLKVYDIFDFYETFLLKVPVELLHDQWLVMAQGFSLVHHNIQMKLKLVIDKLLASTLLLLSLPVMLLVAAAVRLDSAGGVIYSQERVGLNGRVFRIFKFRSMFPDAESEGEKWADPDDDRITRVGRLLRPSRLDELPQLWNVLKEI
jgi:hypothetical protein